MTTLLPPGKSQFSDANGVPLAGGSVFFYIPGTTTFKNTWQDSGQVTLNTNPIVLDAAGQAVIYGAGAYRQIVKDLLGNLIWDQLTASTDTGGVYSGGTSTGTANNQIVLSPIPAGFSLTAGNLITFLAGFANTGPATLNANGTGAKPIVKLTSGGPIALSGGELGVGNAVELFYDGAQYQLLSMPNSALNNSRNAKTAAYAVVNSDKGSTIALGGAAFYTLTFSGAANYDANFSVLVLNEDTGRGKTISLAGIGTFILYPGQSVTVFSQNGAWRTFPAGQRWILPSSVTFYVDTALGNDANDGLAPGASNALKTIQKAINVVSRNSAIDCNNFTPVIQVAAGTYGESLNVFGGLVGADVFNIVGDVVTPSNVVLQSQSTVPCITARDYGTVDVSGIRFASAASNCTFLSAAQSSTIDVHACDFGNGNGATHMYADSGGFINITGNYSVSTAAMSSHMFARYGGSIRAGGGLTVNCVQTMTFSNWWQSFYGGCISANGSAITYTGAGAGAASTGRQYSIQINGTAELDGSTLPGATAGVTASGGQVTL